MRLPVQCRGHRAHAAPLHCPLIVREMPKYTYLDTASLAMTSYLRIIAIALNVGSRGGEKYAVAASGGCTLAGSTEVKSAVESMRTESLS